MQSPLLAGGDDGPSLSGPALNEESEFERLIGQNNAHFGLDERGTDVGVAADYAFLALDPRDAEQNVGKMTVAPPRGVFTTAVAGTLSALHLGLIWASYTADVWAESRLQISLEWQQEFLPLLNDAKETVVRSTNLMSLLQDLDESRNYVLMFLLWFVSLLLPCAFMVVSPTFVLADHMRPIVFDVRWRCHSGRGILETLMRWSLMTFYVVALLSLATSFMELQWTGTSVQAGARAYGPFAAYVTGIASAISLAVLLRSPTSKGNLLAVASLQPAQSQGQTLVPPPPQAFHDPWMSTTVVDQWEEPGMTLLEETQAPAQNPPTSTPSTPSLISEQEPIRESLPFWCKVTAFQLGLLSLLLWIPTFYLPTIRLSYGGIATHFLSEPLLKLFVWEIHGTLWQQGTHCGTPIWILVVTGIVLLVTSLVIPLISTILGIMAWLGDGKWSRTSYAWLFAVYPALGGLVFTLSMVGVVHALTPFANSFVDHETSGLCLKFKEMTGESCLVVSAKTLSGGWFYLLQSLVLELFVWVTLRWA
mmetsp:Transcript_1165/g.3235  ORF Transcript_1165/g.3235 Transcript_1165/m.3235 type:complete len:534 (+) Transcript_1165:105-1706(+)